MASQSLKLAFNCFARFCPNRVFHHVILLQWSLVPHQQRRRPPRQQRPLLLASPFWLTLTECWVRFRFYSDKEEIPFCETTIPSILWTSGAETKFSEVTKVRGVCFFLFFVQNSPSMGQSIICCRKLFLSGAQRRTVHSCPAAPRLWLLRQSQLTNRRTR